MDMSLVYLFLCLTLTVKTSKTASSTWGSITASKTTSAATVKLTSTSTFSSSYASTKVASTTARLSSTYILTTYASTSTTSKSTSTSMLTSRPNAFSTLVSTSTPKLVSTSTPALVSTSTLTFVSTPTPKLVSTSTPALVSTSTPKFVSTSTPTLVSTSTPTLVSTSTPTLVSTSTPAFVSTSKPMLVSTSTPTFVSTSTPKFLSTSTKTFMSLSSTILAFSSVRILLSTSKTSSNSKVLITSTGVLVFPSTPTFISTNNLMPPTSSTSTNVVIGTSTATFVSAPNETAISVLLSSSALDFVSISLINFITTSAIQKSISKSTIWSTFSPMVSSPVTSMNLYSIVSPSPLQQSAQEYFQLRLIGTSDCTQGQTFTNNLTLAIEGSVGVSCNCSFTIASPQVFCYDNISVLFVASANTNEIKYLLDWVKQSNYLILSTLSVDKSLCTYQIPSINAKGCPISTSSKTVISTFEFQVGVAAGGAALVLFLYNLALIGLKLAKRRKEKKAKYHQMEQAQDIPLSPTQTEVSMVSNLINEEFGRDDLESLISLTTPLNMTYQNELFDSAKSEEPAPVEFPYKGALPVIKEETALLMLSESENVVQQNTTICNNEKTTSSNHEGKINTSLQFLESKSHEECASKPEEKVASSNEKEVSCVPHVQEAKTECKVQPSSIEPTPNISSGEETISDKTVQGRSQKFAQLAQRWNANSKDQGSNVRPWLKNEAVVSAERAQPSGSSVAPQQSVLATNASVTQLMQKAAIKEVQESEQVPSKQQLQSKPMEDMNSLSKPNIVVIQDAANSKPRKVSSIARRWDSQNGKSQNDSKSTLQNAKTFHGQDSIAPRLEIVTGSGSGPTSSNTSNLPNSSTPVADGSPIPVATRCQQPQLKNRIPETLTSVSGIIENDKSATNFTDQTVKEREETVIGQLDTPREKITTQEVLADGKPNQLLLQDQSAPLSDVTFSTKSSQMGKLPTFAITKQSYSFDGSKSPSTDADEVPLHIKSEEDDANLSDDDDIRMFSFSVNENDAPPKSKLHSPANEQNSGRSTLQATSPTLNASLFSSKNVDVTDELAHSNLGDSEIQWNETNPGKARSLDFPRFNNAQMWGFSKERKNGRFFFKK